MMMKHIRRLVAHLPLPASHENPEPNICVILSAAKDLCTEQTIADRLAGALTTPVLYLD